MTTVTPVPPASVPLPAGRPPQPDPPRRTFMDLVQKWVTVQSVILTGAVALVAFLVLVPIIYLLLGSFFSNGQFTLQFFQNAYFGETDLLEMIWNSVVFAVGSTILAMVSATALAYLVARTDVPFKSLIYAAALVPLIIPGVLHTVSWIFLASPEIGTLNKLLEPIFGPGLFNVFSMPGMIFVEGFHASPLTFLLMYAAFRNMDPSLEESALVNGAGMLRTIMFVTLPLVKPALFLSLLIMFIRAMSAFEGPALLGASVGIWVFTSRIYYSLIGFPADYGSAGAYSIGLLVILALFALWQMRLSKKARSYQTVSGKGFRPTTVKLGRARYVAGTFVAIYFVLTAVLPIAVLLYTSLLGFYRVPSAEAFANMSFDNYIELFEDSQVLDAFGNSLLLAAGSATIVMIITSLISWLVIRARVRGSGVLNALTNLPLGIPGLIIGVALLFTYLRVPIPIYGSLWILLIAYVTNFLPYGITYTSAAMYQISAELEESGRTSSASWFTIFRKITLPLMMPGLVAGWTFILLIGIRELGASLLLYSPGNKVLSIVIWEQWADGELVELAALGIVMIIMLVILVAIARKLGAKVGVQS